MRAEILSLCCQNPPAPHLQVDLSKQVPRLTLFEHRSQVPGILARTSLLWRLEQYFLRSSFSSQALILQAWHCVTHNTRFQDIGTYYRYNVGTYPIFLILSKDGIIRGFHNICRHRGFPVVSKEHGCSSVIGCRYHGWSYNSKGELTKERPAVSRC
jgi:nitrite reductase/ring-hydroxylating ferredoxin subunit